MVELYVPKYEREHRINRFHLHDSIVERAPHIDFQRDDFKFSSLSLARKISERSRVGDGVCRIIDQMVVDPELPIEVAWEEDNLVLSQYFLADTESSFEVVFNKKFNVESACYLDREGNSGIPDLWPSFATDALALVKIDLGENRDRWYEDLRSRAAGFWQEVDRIDNGARQEVANFVNRLEERTSDYNSDGDWCLFGNIRDVNEHFGWESTILENKKVIQLKSTMRSQWSAMNNILRNYHYEYKNVPWLNYMTEDKVAVCELDCGSYGIRLENFGPGPQDRFSEGLKIVEGDFAAETEGKESDLSSVILHVRSFDYFHPFFDARDPLDSI